MKKKRTLGLLLAFIIVSTLFFGCDIQTFAHSEQNYNGRVFYEIFVRSFNDSNGDGVGDINGVTQKLGYLKDLGVKGIWLMPINSSPSYHGYDVTDYYNVNKDYGTLEDLQKLIKEAHKRDIKVVMDMVINHTSTENTWFNEASTNKEGKYRNYYIWANSSTDLEQVSSINTKVWYPLGDEHYYAVFSKEMPDLNYDNKAVREEMKKIGKFYLDMGIDGFRLDGAMHIYDGEPDKSIAWWKEYNSYVKSINKNAILVGEVWSDTDTIGNYMNGLDSTFDFPAADDIVKAVASGTLSLLADNLKNIYDTYAEKNKNYIDSPFLSNHDQNRVMDLVGKDEEKAKEAAAILLTLQGTPFVYYGEELGMTGSKPDEQIREPFIWDNKDASKNTNWEPSTNDADKIAVNVQENDKNSLLNLYKDLISLRNKSDILKYGSFESIASKSPSVLAYKRVLNNKQAYIYINGDEKNVREDIQLKSAKVLYSNEGNSGKLNLNGKLELKGGEILILQN